ncbi:UNVERIFIED_CONTAM: ATP-binding cassette domain-containing protein [Campylobacter lari]
MDKILEKISTRKLPGNQLLKIKNLRVDFKNGRNGLIRIIRGVDLDIESGQIVGLVGESGSGKSVTSKSLINVNPGSIISADEMIIDNLDLNKINKKEAL